MQTFVVVFSKKAEKDFLRLSSVERDELSLELKYLETNPFPFKKKIKKIKGTRETAYRLRADLSSQSYRVFYTILKPNQVTLLRIVPKKEADRVLAQWT